MKKKIKLGTRGSQLALWQANWVKSEIEKRTPGLEVEIVKIKTTGDKILDVPLAKVGGKGLFVKEIEEALLDKRIDLAVHSMKDVPTDFPKGLHLAAITEREDPRDALIISQKSKVKSQKFKDLHQGAIVGTSSLRRSSQILNIRPDLKISQLRGNLNTRLKKLDEGQFDAIILAAAGVKRLGWADRITEYLPPDVSLPAIGQGALGIETRIDDQEINKLVLFFDHPATSIAVRAERALLKRLEGGCQVPIAAHGEVKGNNLNLIGLVASTDGKKVIKDSVSGTTDKAEALGIELAEKLLKMGAWDILKEVYNVAPPMQGGAG
ncbi:MAG: hydroxymethylbilane synthase [Deltaproteobacteria bacterium GWC2_42_51]|nr:MAG: hydroxymethylbilane synthase [Deltaproteobacteria bacterium GWB2_42_7]OGP33747.1 MAG: hydroxymethylbilane synthase [Deltaproteobacteria bacterium GWC2_42_51]OGP45809.1 MAG: hydroxymethylbilane synthase [Deltaproteobacteria bacterium GWF2_42_12]OGQ26128.1 MAG: hydroxymethylbilane synthase [Deltaproteobacteria bacterium RIFCSPHIGHO2_02_FULL_42_44]OGQ37804.1 MAG: hydroxymethylbilane synthase [Deltaproteobacteria bacterium RIFCSPLOWO2_02_FULL_42_39]OGQ68464.1 MAG: hydroxymethylbilane synth